MLSKWHLNFLRAGSPQPQPPWLTCKACRKTRWGTPSPQLTLLGDQISVENQPGGRVFTEQRRSGRPHGARRAEGEGRTLSVLRTRASWGQEDARFNFAADLRDQRGAGEPAASWGSATFATQHCPLVSCAKTAPLGGDHLPAPRPGLTFPPLFLATSSLLDAPREASRELSCGALKPSFPPRPKHSPPQGGLSKPGPRCDSGTQVPLRCEGCQEASLQAWVSGEGLCTRRLI